MINLVLKLLIFCKSIRPSGIASPTMLSHIACPLLVTTPQGYKPSLSVAGFCRRAHAKGTEGVKV